MMDSALSRGTAVMASHGGKVLLYAGANILAACGLDEDREDDAGPNGHRIRLALHRVWSGAGDSRAGVTPRRSFRMHIEEQREIVALCNAQHGS
ncbi:MAG: hypothetical protein IH582_10910 [Afipia sp.]|nr:hypothetical protein [Afipia sp.]